MCSIIHPIRTGQEIQDIHVSHWNMFGNTCTSRAGSLIPNDSITVVREVRGGVWLDKQLITSVSASAEFTKAKLVSTETQHMQLTGVHTCNMLSAHNESSLKHEVVGHWSAESHLKIQWCLGKHLNDESRKFLWKWYLVDCIFKANYLQIHRFLCQAAVCVLWLWLYNQLIHAGVS